MSTEKIAGGKRARLTDEEQQRLGEPWAIELREAIPVKNDRDGAGLRGLQNQIARSPLLTNRQALATTALELKVGSTDTDQDPRRPYRIYQCLRGPAHLLQATQLEYLDVGQDHVSDFLRSRAPLDENMLDEADESGHRVVRLTSEAHYVSLHQDLHLFFRHRRPSDNPVPPPPPAPGTSGSHGRCPKWSDFWKMWNAGTRQDKIMLIGFMMGLSAEEVGAWLVDATKFTTLGLALIHVGPSPGFPNGRIVFPPLAWMSRVISRYALYCRQKKSQHMVRLGVHGPDGMADYQVINRLKTLRQKSNVSLSIDDFWFLSSTYTMARGRISNQYLRHARAQQHMGQLNHVAAVVAKALKEGTDDFGAHMDPHHAHADIIGCPSCGALDQPVSAPACNTCQMPFFSPALDRASHLVAMTVYRRAVLTYLRGIADEARALEALEAYLADARDNQLPKEWMPK